MTKGVTCMNNLLRDIHISEKLSFYSIEKCILKNFRYKESLGTIRDNVDRFIMQEVISKPHYMGQVSTFNFTIFYFVSTR